MNGERNEGHKLKYRSERELLCQIATNKYRPGEIGLLSYNKSSLPPQLFCVIVYPQATEYCVPKSSGRSSCSIY